MTSNKLWAWTSAVCLAVALLYSALFACAPTNPESLGSDAMAPAPALRLATTPRAQAPEIGKWPTPAHGSRPPYGRGTVARPQAPDARTPLEIAHAACSGAHGWACTMPAGKTVLASSPTNNGTWTVPDWYVDPANSTGCASSSNTCTSATCASGGIGPCRLVNDIVNRWGTDSPILTQNTTIHQLSAETLNQESIVLTPITSLGHYFALIGTPQLLMTFTAGTVTPKNRATGQLLQIATAPTLPETTLIINNTRSSSRAQVVTEEAADGGPSSTLTMSQPIAATTPAVWAGNFPAAMPAEDNTWATGDSLSAYSLPLSNIKVWQPVGGDATSASLGGAAWMQYVSIPDSSGTPGDSYFAAGIPQGCVDWYVDMSMGPYFELSGTSAGGVDGGFAIDVSSIGGVTVTSGTYWAGFSDTFGMSVGAFGGLDGDAIGIPSVGAYADGFFGAVYAKTTTFIYGNGHAKLDDIWVTGQAFMYGPMVIEVDDGSSLEKTVGIPWTSALLNTGGELLRGIASGVAYRATTDGGFGQWQDGITLTPANLDLYSGLQDPTSGARYF